MVGCKPSVGRIFRFLGAANELGPFFFSSWAERVNDKTNASDTTSKRMDELYTMPHPRQCHCSKTLSGLSFRRTKSPQSCGVHPATLPPPQRPIRCEGGSPRGLL